MSTGLHTREREPTDRRPLWIGLIVLALLLVAVMVWRGVTDSGEEAGCDDGVAKARLAASPDIAPALEQVARGLAEESPCVSLAVETVPADEVVNQLTAGSGDAPDLWVPDSDVWARQLAENGVSAETVMPAIAASPVVLVGGPAADAPESWLVAASSGLLAMQNPLESTPSALALVAVRAEREKSGASVGQLTSGLVSAAQHYGEGETDRSSAEALSALTASSKRVVPVSEQQFLQALLENRSLSAMVPATGPLMQRYPLLGLPGRSEESGAVLAQFVDFLQRPQGSTLLTDHGFRPADETPLPGERGVGAVDALKAPSAEDVEEDLRSWQVLAVPSSMLVVLDASGSMDFETGSGTRMQLAADAAKRALGAFPGNARIGMWLFSVDQGGPGVDHRVMEPLRRLDATTGAGTQREALGGAINEALGLTQGGTGLYDTTLAAYRNAMKHYDDDYFNSVVLMTDGANDDPGSIALTDLLTTLRAEVDAAKPVRIIAIGISKDADMGALKKIAAATGGQAFAARDPRGIIQVMSQALLAR
ncbi:substrate-binding domain-containing protein [Nocardioides jensenii]|uniref:substrate-binding domain-containing protein n=1 Tax=Nocardioides jensenii TaxID=1843 RepID=UPI00082CF1C5|nr:substrate-binding domain-containing protein [Nocardioides jensenii]